MLVFILMLASMPTSIALTIVPAHKQEPANVENLDSQQFYEIEKRKIL